MENESMSPRDRRWIVRVCVYVFVRVIACGTGNVGTREAIYNVPRY